ncbi:MAG: ABC transporter permease, partial [Phycisphaeraceae bacterium]
MYKLLLILKYLRRKLAPMFAALAVTICTFMVIVVISVMGGFLDLLRSSVQQLSGDVIVTADSLTGFPDYEDLIEQLEATGEVAAATPTLESYGLLKLGRINKPVQLMGIRPESYAEVVQYRDSLHWSDQEKRYLSEGSEVEVDLREAAMELDPPSYWPEGDRPGMVLGIEVNPYHYRDEQGEYHFANAAVRTEAVITVVPLTEQGAFYEDRPNTRGLVVVNEFKSGHYEVDAHRAFVPLGLLQEMLDMAAGEPQWDFDPETGERVGEPTADPARVTQVLVRGEAGVPLAKLKEVVEDVRTDFLLARGEMPPLAVRTWEEQNATLLSAVQNEKGLVTFLFAIISVVAIVMVATTFYMIVLEKTRDIGILRAVGASRGGIMNVFLGYGLAVGIVGTLIGGVLAWLTVTNLNEIQ